MWSSPLTLYLLLKVRTNAQFRFLFIILLFLIPIFHPVVNIALILVLLTAGLPQPLFIFSGSKLMKFDGGYFTYSLPSLIILVIWSVTWLSSFGLWNVVISNVYSFVTEGGESNLQRLFSGIAYAESYGYSAVEQFIKIYGGKVLFVLLALISIPLLRKEELSPVYRRCIGSMWNPLAALVFLLILLYATDLIFGPNRLLPYFMVFCTIFTGYTLYRVLHSKWCAEHKNYFVRLCPFVTVTAILALAFTSGILNFYNSPFTIKPGNHLTRSETVGMSWFFSNRDKTLATSCILINPSRFADFLLSRDEKQTQGYIAPPTIPTYHFGYDKGLTLGASYMESAYMLLAKMDRDFYVYVLPDMAGIRYLPEDFKELENDYSLDKLYTNGGLDIWYIRGSGESR